MKNTLAGVLIAAAMAAASSAGAATTIDATHFNLSYLGGFSSGAFDMTLLSESNGTIRIGIQSGLSATSTSSGGAMESNGDFATQQFSGSVGQGYRITSLTLSADAAGTLYVEQPSQCGGCTIVWPGVAENGAGMGLTIEQDGASTALPRGVVANLNGAGRLEGGGAAAIDGTFLMDLGASNYVSAQGYYQVFFGPDHYNEYWYDASASIGLTNMVLTVQVAAVPEPSTYAMLLAGLGVAGWAARRKRA